MGAERAAAPPAVLIYNSHLPVFPGGGGVEALTTRELARRAEAVALVSALHSPAEAAGLEPLRAAGVHLHLWRAPDPTGPPAGEREPAVWRARLGGLRRGLWALCDPLPADLHAFALAQARLAETLWEALCARPWPVHVVVESASAAVLAALPRTRLSVLVLHDVRARVYARRAALSHVSPAGWWWRLQARRYRRFEAAACRRADLVTTVSEDEAAWVRRYYRPRALQVVPLPLEAGYFAPQPAELEVPGRVVFSGLMDHAPNADAAVFFARRVLPLVRARLPQAHFQIVGRRPLPAVLELARLPGVEVTGAVPDVRPWLASASVVVVPLRFGSGARQKILEAWALERCVVSTTLGAEGLGAEHGRHLWLADGADALAESVSRALSDPARRESVRRAGARLVREHHDPPRVAAQLHERLRELAAGAPVRPAARVLLDLRWMAPGLAGGLESVGRAWLRELPALDPDGRYAVLLPAAVRHELGLERLRATRGPLDGGPAWAAVSRDDSAALAQVLALGLRRAAWRVLRLGAPRPDALVRLQRLAALDAEIACSPAGYVHPELHPLRQLVLVPDVQHEFFPQFFAAAALAERRRLFGAALQRAERVLAISEFTRRTLIERLGVPPERVGTAPLAAGPEFHTGARPQDARCLRRLGLADGAFLLFPAHTWQHKNHRTAVAALRVLRERHGQVPPLVCTGEPREAHAALLAQVARETPSGQVRFVGRLPVDELAALYRHARALVFPSLFEGFGMPVLEAMASGCPVLCSRAAALPEVAGTAAWYVEAEDSEGLADALAALGREPERRQALAGAGLERAAQFSWRRHVTSVLQAIDALRAAAAASAGAASPPAAVHAAHAVESVAVPRVHGRRVRSALALQRASARWAAGRRAGALAGWFGAAVRAPEVLVDAWLAPALHRWLARLVARARARRQRRLASSAE